MKLSSFLVLCKEGRKEGRVLVMFPLRLLMTTINSHATGTSNSLQGSIGGFLTSTEKKKKVKKLTGYDRLILQCPPSLDKHAE